MKRISWFLTLLLLLASCETNKKAKASGKYFIAFYFRYIEDTGEMTAELVPAKGSEAGKAKPAHLPGDVHINSLLLTEGGGQMNLPLKYSAQFSGALPPKIELQIAGLDTIPLTPAAVPQLSIRQEQSEIELRAGASLGGDSRLILTFSDDTGNAITRTVKGPVSFPIRQKIPVWDAPVHLSVVVQREEKHTTDRLSLQARLEYYLREVVLQ